MKTERVVIKDKSIVKHNIESVKNLYKHPSIIDYLPAKNESLEKRIEKLTPATRSPIRP